MSFGSVIGRHHCFTLVLCSTITIVIPQTIQVQALQRAADVAGGVQALAAALGVAASLPSMWKARGRVPPEHCAAIERVAASAVTRRDLRPDDWHRIWPELVTADHPAPTESDTSAQV